MKQNVTKFPKSQANFLVIFTEKNSIEDPEKFLKLEKTIQFFKTERNPLF